MCIYIYVYIYIYAYTDLKTIVNQSKDDGNI